ncbi:MAG: ATP synthase F1 subunit delta [Bacteroidota bacterium]|nr:ATP synthase F1 subunit delta [Bacteroidota bacterium]
MNVASTYAKSLINLAIESNQLEAVRNDMKLIEKVCSQNHDFINLLNSPIVKTDKKQAIFKSVFDGKISNLTLTFINLIAAKRRESYIANIATAFDEQYKTFLNITSATVLTAVALDDTLKNEILNLVKKTTTGSVELIQKIDPTLIGGFVLTINDKQIDQSVKRKLNDLRKNFANSENVLSIN